MAGSSPLARGLPRHWPLRAGHVGIIPARAGFTNPCTDRRERAADHPRSRGVYADATMRGAMTVGSSPLARGLLDLGVQGGQAARIIPARAGFTHRGGLDRVACQDHPRSRGVYGDWIATAADAAGSSPLARGLLRVDLPEPGLHRIIPARAGFTVRRLGSAGDGVGSSPLARGLPAEIIWSSDRLRIIPARAGFTDFFALRALRWQDHPRSRGVYSFPIGLRLEIHGSSPLARGLRADGSLQVVFTRIIPARAGFTRLRAHRHAARQDHPRSRGVYPGPSGPGC